MKASNQLTITNVIDGKDSVSIILTDENHTFSANSSGQAAAASITTGIQAYKGTSKIATTVGSITGLPAGMTMTVNNNNSASTSISVNVTASLTALSGTVNIPITADGISFTKIFSFTLSKAGTTGNTGAAAKSVDITATSQIFKSTDGGATFSPDTIKLTPIFQGGISFSKWQYSTNGGTTWTDVTSGSNGLTISSGVLTIAKTCSLFTESVTSLSFKCISNNATYFDVMTVLKLYDVTDIQIGGRNLLLHSGKKITSSTYLMKSYSTSELKPNTKYTMVLKGSIASPNRFGVWFNGGNSHGAYFPYNQTDTAEYITVTTPTALTATTVNVYNYPSTTASESTIEWAAMYEGEILPPLDWTPAPEDIEEQFTAVTDTVKTAQSKIDAVEGKITNKVWRSDVITIQDSEGNIREKTLVDHLVQNMIDSNGITNTVQDIETELGNPNDPSSGTSIYSKITKAQQTADKFTWLVKSGNSSSSMTLTDSFLSILARDIDITGKVTFNSFDSSTKTQIQTAVNKIDDWSYDSTTIDGGKIATSTITADKIVAHSITVDKLIIGDITNYATVNEKIPESMLPNTHFFGGTFIAAGDISNSTRSLKFLSLSDFFINPFHENDVLHYSITITGERQMNCYLKVMLYNTLTYDSAGNVNSVSPDNISINSIPFTAFITPQTYQGSLDLSGNNINDYKYCLIGISTDYAGFISIRNATIKRKLNSEIITDGSITAECLAVDAIRSRSFEDYLGGQIFSMQGLKINLEGSGYIKSQNFAITSTGTAYFRGTINATSGTIGSTSSGWQISGNTIKGLSSTSKIISGVLESSNYIADTQGVRIDLNTGIINGDIRANNMSALNSYRIHDSIHESTIITADFGMDSDVAKIVVFGFQESRDSPNSNYAGTAYMATYDFDDGHSKVEIVSDMINLVTDNLGGAVNCEMVSANGGRCWKFSNGLAIAVKAVSVQTASPTSYGNMYYGNIGTPLGNMPITFKNIFYRNFTYDSGGTEWLVWYPGDYTKWSGTIYPYSPVKTTAYSARDLRAVCIGTWK